MHKDTKTPTNIAKQKDNKEKLNVYINQKYGKEAKTLKISNSNSTTKVVSLRKSTGGRSSPTKEQR